MNPYLPMTAFTPDGEPRVFEDPDNPGKYRVYIHSSTDERTKLYYCGYCLAVWSAPVDDLTEWTNHGEIVHIKQFWDIGHGLAENGAEMNPLQGPAGADVVYSPVTGKYHLYTQLGMGSFQSGNYKIWMAESKRPDGPFEVFSEARNNCKWPDINGGPNSWDAAVHIEEVDINDTAGTPAPDGKKYRAYAYWGFGAPTFQIAELDLADMITLKPGTLVKNPYGFPCFFEAASIRKIGDKYVIAYSGNRGNPADPRYGTEAAIPENQPNIYPGISLMAASYYYSYADYPLGNPAPVTELNPSGREWIYGGEIVSNAYRGGPDKEHPNREHIQVFRGGNNHGGMFQIPRDADTPNAGKWFINFQRHTRNEYSRQAVMQPLNVSFGSVPGKEIDIQKTFYSSSGFTEEGLDAYKRYNAGILCYREGNTGDGYCGEFKSPDGLNPITLQNNWLIGYEYLNFGDVPLTNTSQLTLKLNVKTQAAGSVEVYIDDPSASGAGPENDPLVTKKKLIGVIPFSNQENSWYELQGAIDKIDGCGITVRGKRGVYLKVVSGESGYIFSIKEFEFAQGADIPTPNPLNDILPFPSKGGLIYTHPTTRARAGESVVIKALPINGYTFSNNLAVKNTSTGEIITTRCNQDGSREFKMPDNRVSLYAGFDPVSPDSEFILPEIDFFVSDGNEDQIWEKKLSVAEYIASYNRKTNELNPAASLVDRARTRFVSNLIMGDGGGSYHETFLKYKITGTQKARILKAHSESVTINMPLNTRGDMSSADIYAFLIPYDKLSALKYEGTSPQGYATYRDMYNAGLTYRENRATAYAGGEAAKVTITGAAKVQFDLTSALREYFRQNPEAEEFGLVLTGKAPNNAAECPGTRSSAPHQWTFVPMASEQWPGAPMLYAPKL